MIYFPDDIFSEPEDVDPDTLANLGPLRRLAGVWEGKRGISLRPAEEGPERRGYAERISLQPIDPQTNGPQLFYGLRYHAHMVASDEYGTFQDQVGYWLWEPATDLVIQTIASPRGQIAMASGTVAPDASSIILNATRGEVEYGICSSSFLDFAYRPDRYTLELTFNPDGSWNYLSETILAVRGWSEPFRQQYRNTLEMVAEPQANPLCAGENVVLSLSGDAQSSQRPPARL